MPLDIWLRPVFVAAAVIAEIDAVGRCKPPAVAKGPAHAQHAVRVHLEQCVRWCLVESLFAIETWVDRGRVLKEKGDLPEEQMRFVKLEETRNPMATVRVGPGSQGH